MRGGWRSLWLPPRCFRVRYVPYRVVSYPTRSIGPVRSRLSVSMHRDAGIDESTPAYMQASVSE